MQLVVFSVFKYMASCFIHKNYCKLEILYLYNLLSFTSIIQNLQPIYYHGILQASILQCLTEELIVINPFIVIYKTSKEQLDAESDTDQALRVLLNLQLKLIIEQLGPINIGKIYQQAMRLL